LSVSLLLAVLALASVSQTLPGRKKTVGPQKGAFKAQSQAIYRDLNHDGLNYSLPN
jgi:hypothetical protein